MVIYLSGNHHSKELSQLKSILDRLGYAFTEKGEGSAQHIEDFSEVHDYILAADTVIVDSAGLDESNRFEVPLALKLDKPVLVVASTPKALDNFKSTKHRKLVLKDYKNESDLEKVLMDFLSDVKDTLDAKLFMIIPPTVNKYLDWVATHTNKSKSDVVRAAVEDVAKTDKSYQSFLKKYQK